MTPQKISKKSSIIFLKTAKNIEIQNFEPQKIDPSLSMYEIIGVPPPGIPPSPPYTNCSASTKYSQPSQVMLTTLSPYTHPYEIIFPAFKNLWNKTSDIIRDRTLVLLFYWIY